MQISKKEAISDSGATGSLVLSGTPVKNVQPASTPISINQPDGSKIKSKHTWNIYITGISEEAKRAHIVPNLAHASLISIRDFCGAGCKVQYYEDICSVYYNNKLVWKGGREPQTIFGYLHCKNTIRHRQKHKRSTPNTWHTTHMLWRSEQHWSNTSTKQHLVYLNKQYWRQFTINHFRHGLDSQRGQSKNIS